MSPAVSFVVPAHNEEAELGPTLAAINAAGRALGESFEIVVVDDASTDRTAEIAAALGATVVPIQRRQISAARNAGARAARAPALLFVDADTRVSPHAVASALRALRLGAAGGGARMAFDDGVPWWAWLILAVSQVVFACVRASGGCFLFARRDAFEAIGGFDERYFASEELHFSRAIAARGPFAIVYRGVRTSARKFRLYGGLRLLGVLFRLARGGQEALRRREGLEVWYDGRRESSPAVV